METAGTSSIIPIIATVIGSHGLLAVVLVGIALRLGGLPTRKEYNDLRGDVSDNKQEIVSTRAELKQEITDTKAELRQEIADTKAELRQEIADTKAELRQEIVDAKTELRQEIANTKMELEAKIDAAKDEVLREIRRSHQQLVLTLVNHTHNANGQAVFTLPPETEPTPADN